MNNILFIVILLIGLIICQVYKKDFFESIFDNKITFELKNSSGLNLSYLNNNFYFTNGIPYKFEGLLSSNGMYKLQDGIQKLNYELNFNISDASDSHIELEKPIQSDSNEISNLFNQTDKNIYLDTVNKIIVSNDDSGNKVYMGYFIDGSPVNWNYNIDNAITFDINYL